jgi:hypothetical protein
MPGNQDVPAISRDGRQVAFRYSRAPHPGIYTFAVARKIGCEGGGSSGLNWDDSMLTLLLLRMGTRFRAHGKRKSPGLVLWPCPEAPYFCFAIPPVQQLKNAINS